LRFSVGDLSGLASGPGGLRTDGLMVSVLAGDELRLEPSPGVIVAGGRHAIDTSVCAFFFIELLVEVDDCFSTWADGGKLSLITSFLAVAGFAICFDLVFVCL